MKNETIFLTESKRQFKKVKTRQHSILRVI